MTDSELRLPDPDRRGERPLEWTLDQRQSVRIFLRQALTSAQVGQLLWAAQGVKTVGGRTAPSAGARYPLEIYAVTAEGVAHYDPAHHRLQPTLARDVRAELARAALGQDFIRVAPLTIVLCAVFERVASRYGKGRGERYVLFEVGHAAQNVLLQAVALGLGAVPVGAFRDEDVHRLLELPDDQPPLYLLPVGYPG